MKFTTNHHIVYKRLRENNEKIPQIDLAAAKVEPPNETIKMELKKRYDAMIDKYEYKQLSFTKNLNIPLVKMH